MSKGRVVITGMGAITPIGNNKEEIMQTLIEQINYCLNFNRILII